MRCLLATVCACESQVQGSHKPPRAVQGPSYGRDVCRFQFRSLDSLSFHRVMRDLSSVVDDTRGESVHSSMITDIHFMDVNSLNILLYSSFYNS